MDRIIEKNFDKQWPAQSPDLTLADFNLWPALKREMHNENNPYKSISQLKRAITNEFQQFKNNDFDFITTEVVKRQKLCIQNMGDTW